MNEDVLIKRFLLRSINNTCVCRKSSSTRVYSSTCHERTPGLGPRQKCPYVTGGRSSEGRVGGTKRNRSTPCTSTFTTTSAIHTEYNIMHCHNNLVIEPKINNKNNITAVVLYSTRTLVANVSQLLALHVFHIRPAARIPLGHDGSLWPLCLLRYVLFARQQALYTMHTGQN